MKRARRARCAVALVALVAGMGCTFLVPDGESLMGGDGDGSGPAISDANDVTNADVRPDPDAGFSDGSDASDAGDAGDAGILHSWTFDLGCAGWAAHSATFATETTSPLSPPAACRICAQAGAADDFGAYAVIPDSAAGFVVAEAHGRSAPGSGAMTLVVLLYTGATDFLRNETPTGEAGYQTVAVAKEAPTGTTVFVKGSSSASSPCILIDDVTLRR